MGTNGNNYESIYSGEWLRLGIVSAAEVEHHEKELAEGDDPHPEHYRWRSFVRFVHGLPSLSPALARSLYALGASDPDSTLSESIKSVVLRHDDCPRDLHEDALQSETEHLVRVAKARMGAQNA